MEVATWYLARTSMLKSSSFQAKLAARLGVFALSTLALVLIAVIDRRTDPQIGVALFYLLPVVFAAGLGGRYSGPVVAVLAAIVWYLSDVNAGPAYTIAWAPVWNSFTRLVYFVTAAVLVREYRAKRRAQEDLQRLNLELESRVQQRTSQLSSLNRELESFNNSIAHDLRTPLRGIDGYSHVLLEEYGDKLDERAREYLRRVAANTSKMGELIDSLLTLSQLNQGELRLTVVDLSAIAREVASTLEASDPQRSVNFEVASGLMVMGDPDQLRMVVHQLLENAWKFTRNTPRGRVIMGRKPERGGSAIFVRDNGAGFDPRYSAKLFTPFQRLHSPGEFDGQGVGLATVERILKRHGGSIWAQGRVGGGATFFFTLPMAGVAEEPAGKERSAHAPMLAAGPLLLEDGARCDGPQSLD